MKAADPRLPRYNAMIDATSRRWQVLALGEPVCELSLATAATKDEVQRRFPGCHVAPIADTDRAAAPSKEADDDD